jgi:hypothetical protein
MKTCDKIEKLITISDLGDLSIKERDKIAKHTAICEKCRLKVKEMEGYFSFIQSLQKDQPTLDNPSSLTDSIIGSINELKANPSVVHKSNTFKIQPVYFRVAATVLLFIMTGFYVQQYVYVSQMESSLRLTYEIKNSNKPLLNSYNECLNYSEDFIRDQLIADTRYLNQLVMLSKQYPIRGYRSLASAVCLRSNSEFNNATLEMKKRMVIEILNSSINQNH